MVATTSGTIIKPEGFIVCNEVDVQIAIKCAKNCKTHLAIKSGEHSFESYFLGLNSSWDIDLSKLNKINVNYVEETVTIEGGVTLYQVIKCLKKRNYFTPSICKTISVSGMSMGREIGIVGLKYELTLDKLEEMKIVTADEKKHPKVLDDNFAYLAHNRKLVTVISYHGICINTLYSFIPKLIRNIISFQLSFNQVVMMFL
ncbi:FAD-binding dehydrogenase-like protein [Leptotrombidium deliense]|uniref:FAD-binding dehydrogenase-like protein n=1 Tax=Leptotrombidium deliense TaxID=299467 RepID=A0A443SB80_9ACAR|nr:FAD-binding dehydrogenase-like protein [Leptotrombidium deliense]